MSRQNMYPSPWKKNMEAYNDFGGGLNTVTSNDNLRIDECPELDNVDLGSRGSLERRYGMVSHIAKPAAASGLGQGYFRYYKPDGTFEEIVAIGGNLYKNGVLLPITSLSSFQATKLIEAVQFGDILYIATGTKFVQYNGIAATIVAPYVPNPLDALYIGTNGLATDPDSYITDGVASVIKIAGVTVDLRYGIVNSPSTFTAYYTKPASVATLDFQFEYRVKGAVTWVVGQAWSLAKTWVFTPLSATDFEVQVKARNTASPTPEYMYVMPTYTVNQTNTNSAIAHDTMHDCNRILLYWDRIILYGDPTQPRAMFISHLKNPAYFPIPNSLEISNEKQEILNIIIQYRDSLIAFTDTNIQAIFGKYPAEFVRIKQHASIGCIAPESAKVVENTIVFRSREGIHSLRSVSVSENRADVKRIDTNIANIVPLDTDACGVVYDNQYHLLFPQSTKRLRYYYENQRKPWTKDTSQKLNFSRFYKHNDDLYGQSKATGEIYRFDKDSVDDAGYIFTDKFELKSFDMGEPYNPKKLKELQLLVNQQSTKLNCVVRVYADEALVLDPDQSYASVNPDGSVVWNTVSTPNLIVDTGTALGVWELGHSRLGSAGTVLKKLAMSGKCRKVRLTLEHTGSENNTFFGLAFVFKTKKP